MPRSDIEHHLLFGILAVQVDFVTPEQLVTAVRDWLADKSRPLDLLLLEQGALDSAERAILSPLVERHIVQHGGDPQQSLAAISSLGSAAAELRALGDADLDATLSLVARDRHATDDVDTMAAPTDSPTREEMPGKGLRYRVLRPHAKGGLGEVALAEDVELNREVALKVIRPQLADDEGNRTRFVLEAEITGGLEHPGIVPVYGLGQYGDGRPYYAMRFIRGDSLKEAADRFHEHVAPNDVGRPEATVRYGGLAFRKLLGRLIDVCNAVAYAHSRGVLHRDLKPGNIMLGKYGETLVVDWGLAKLSGREEPEIGSDEGTLKPRSGSSVVETQMGSVVGTPAYMPPEQAEGSLDQVGPASDFYSLGATLYYLLTRSTPVRGEDLQEVLQRARSGDIAPPRSHDREIPRPLDAICMRAMAAKPDDRYSSPQHLADELERYLADEPVKAYVEPWANRARRWTRKHPRFVAAVAATVLIGLISTVVIASLVTTKNQELATANGKLDQANVELVEKNEALVAANTAEREAKEEAEAKRREAEAVLTFFEDRVLAAARPEDQQGGLGITATIRNAVDAAEPLIGVTFEDRPLVEARLRTTIASTYDYVGEYDLAMVQFERARDLQMAHLGPDHVETMVTMSNFAQVYTAMDRIEEALEIQQSLFERSQEQYGPHDDATLTLRANLASTYQDLGRTEEAETMLNEVLEVRQQTLGDGHPDTLRIRNNLAELFSQTDRLEDALAVHQQNFEATRESLGPNHPDTLSSMSNLAKAHARCSQLDDAISQYETVLDLRREQLGGDHPDTLGTMNSLANALAQAIRYDEAVSLLEETYALQQGKLGHDHSSTLVTGRSLGRAYGQIGQLDKALPLLEEVLDGLRAKFDDEHLETLKAMNELALVYGRLGQFKDALPLYEDAYRFAQQGTDPGFLDVVRNNLALAYDRAGRLPDALPLLELSLTTRKEKRGPTHPETLTAMNNLAYGYDRAGRSDEAVEMYKEAIPLMKEHMGADHPTRLTCMNNLATVYLNAGRLEEARPIYEEALEQLRKKLGPGHPTTLTPLTNLSALYAKMGRYDLALPLFDEVNNGYRKLWAANEPRFAIYLAKLALFVMKSDQYEAAEGYLRECLEIRERTLGDDWLVYSTKSMLGGTIVEQGAALVETDAEAAARKFEAAQPLLIDGHEGLKQRESEIPAAGTVRLTESLERLVRLYVVWEKPQEAARWQAELTTHLEQLESKAKAEEATPQDDPGSDE